MSFARRVILSPRILRRITTNGEVVIPRRSNKYLSADDACLKYYPTVQIQQSQSFFTLPTPFKTAKKKEYSERRLLGYSMEQMYDVVANVENYYQFVPWCTGSTVTKKRSGNIEAEMVIGFPPFAEKYTSVVTLSQPNLVKAVCKDGKMFSHLLTTWKLSPGVNGKEQTCTLDFSISFEFRSALHSNLSHIFFDEVVRQMVNAFLREAERRHGKQSIKTQPPQILQCVS